MRHTRATLRSWQRTPGAVLGKWAAGSAVAAIGLLLAVWIVSSLDHGYQQILTLQPPFVVGGVGDVLKVLESNMLVLALHAMACVAGFIAGSSLPLQAEHHHGLSRWVHEHGGRIAIGFVVCATTFSLSAQAYLIGHSLAGVSHFLRVSPGCSCWAFSRMRCRSSSPCSFRWRPGSSPAGAASGSSCSPPPW